MTIRRVAQCSVVVVVAASLLALAVTGLFSEGSRDESSGSARGRPSPGVRGFRTTKARAPLDITLDRGASRDNRLNTNPRVRIHGPAGAVTNVEVFYSLAVDPRWPVQTATVRLDEGGEGEVVVPAGTFERKGGVVVVHARLEDGTVRETRFSLGDPQQPTPSSLRHTSDGEEVRASPSR